MRNNALVPRFTPRRLGIAILTLSALVAVYVRVISQRRALQMIDLQVYKEGGEALLKHAPLYDFLTLQNNLPFTYPPFAAWLAVPFALMPFAVSAVIWQVLQIYATYKATDIAMRKPMVAMYERFGPRAEMIPFLIAAAFLWMEPVNDGIFFGQVNAFLVLACMADLGLRQVRWPRGALTGLAAAVKLTPGVFWVHYMISGQWRLLRNSLLAAGGVTLFVAAVDWDTSKSFWFDAIRQPERLGANINLSNQSIRGMLMRLGAVQQWDEHTISLIWLVCVIAVAVPSFLLARRFHAIGDRACEVGVVGLMAVLLSPVAWIHHLHWLVVLLPGLIGDGRSRRRWITAGILWFLLLLRLPWVGHGMRGNRDWPGWAKAIGMVLEDGYGLLAIALIVILWVYLKDGHTQGAVSEARSRGAEGVAPLIPFIFRFRSTPRTGQPDQREPDDLPTT